MLTPVSSLVDQLRRVLDGLGAIDWRASDPGAVAMAAVALSQGADRLEAISLLAVAEHEQRGGVSRDGDASAGDWTSRQADAAIAFGLAARAQLEADEPSRAGRFQAQVLVRYEDLVGEQVAEWAGEVLQTGQPFSGHAVRRLCCDAGIVRMVTKGDSQVVDVGRLTRSIPVPTERAVLARDGHRCTFPGCHARDGLQVHHIEHWGRFGPTDLDNLACLCWRHHRLVHEGGWDLTFDESTDRTTWLAPDGRRLIGQRRATAGASATAA